MFDRRRFVICTLVLFTATPIILKLSYAKLSSCRLQPHILRIVMSGIYLLV